MRSGRSRSGYGPMSPTSCHRPRCLIIPVPRSSPPWTRTNCPAGRSCGCRGSTATWGLFVRAVVDPAVAAARIAREFEDWAPELTALITDSDTAPVLRLLHSLPTEHQWDRVPGVTLLG